MSLNSWPQEVTWKKTVKRTAVLSIIPYVYGHMSDGQSLIALAFLKKSSNPTSQTQPETLLEHS